MKKVKKRRILSVLLTICLLSAMVPLSTNAATFSDDASIKHTDAVQYLTDIGVITGYPDGRFGPNGTLTRAEACAILTRLTGGSPLGRTAFMDVPDGYWAEGYISYCTFMGYVNGYGDGTFGPADTLTGSAWSKMVLGALGYDAETSGMTGIGWATAVADLAEAEDLYDDISNFNPDSAVSRDNACQIAYNGVYEPSYENPPVKPHDPNGSSMLSKLTYAFPNSGSSFGYGRGDRIPYEPYRIMFGDTQFAKMLYEQIGAWGGSCYGLSSTSGMFYQPGNDVNVSDFNASASVPSELSVSDEHRSWDLTLQQFIEVMHVSQYADSIQSDYSNNTSLSDVCRAVEQFQNGTGGPVIIAVFGRAGGSSAGHALLGYAIENDELRVYDCNFPGDSTRSIELSKDSSGSYTGWFYSMNDTYDWGTRYSGSSIAYIPYNDFYQLWQNRAIKTSSSMALLTSNGDITVKTPDGSPVAELRGGEVTPADDYVIPFVDIGLTKDGTSGGKGITAAWVPAGAYSIERASSDSTGGKLEVSITHVDQSVDIVTDADNMTVEVNDRTKTRTASLDPDETGSSFSITIESTLDSGDEPSAIILNGTVSDEGVAIGREDGSFVDDGVDPGDIIVYYDGAVG